MEGGQDLAVRRAEHACCPSWDERGYAVLHASAPTLGQLSASPDEKALEQAAEGAQQEGGLPLQ